jgi:hypothetical protein
MEQDLKTMLAAWGCRSTGRGDDSLSNAIQEAKDRGLLDSHDSAVNFVHASYDDEDIDEDFGLLRQIKDLLKVLGSKYIGRVSLWLYKRLQVTAGRVVSNPQGLTTPSPQASPFSQNVTSEVESPPSKLSPAREKIRPSIQSPAQTDGPKGLNVSPGPRRAQKGKSSPHASSEGPFECKLHGLIFKGKYAWQRYKRHLERTKQHTLGNEPFRCHRCPARMARIEHFQSHMRKYHNLRVLGRKGSYLFRDFIDVVDARVELADTAAAGGEAWVPVVPVVLVD